MQMKAKNKMLKLELFFKLLGVDEIQEAANRLKQELDAGNKI
jgi:hypothetical protein